MPNGKHGDKGTGEARKAALLEGLRAALPDACHVRFGDDAIHAHGHSLVPGDDGVLLVVEEDWQAALAERCASALGYVVHEIWLGPGHLHTRMFFSCHPASAPTTSTWRCPNSRSRPPSFSVVAWSGSSPCRVKRRVEGGDLINSRKLLSIVERREPGATGAASWVPPCSCQA